MVTEPRQKNFLLLFLPLPHGILTKRPMSNNFFLLLSLLMFLFVCIFLPPTKNSIVCIYLLLFIVFPHLHPGHLSLTVYHLICSFLTARTTALNCLTKPLLSTLTVFRECEIQKNRIQKSRFSCCPLQLWHKASLSAHNRWVPRPPYI